MTRFYKVLALLSLMFSVSCYSMPFLRFKDYASLTGIDLITNLTRRIELESSVQTAKTYVFGSTSTYLMLALIFLLITLGLMLGSILKNWKKSLDAAILTISAAIVSYGLQLTNSETSVADFFGKILLSMKTRNGGIAYKPSEIIAATGIGARLLVVLCLLSLALIAGARIIAAYEKYSGSNIKTPWSMAMRQFVRNRLAIIGAAIIILLIILCFFGPVFSNYSLLKTNILTAKESPGMVHLLGTDSSGRDILTRLMYGGRISLTVGFVVVVLEILIGAAIGGVAGYYGGRLDNILMRVVDIFLSLPFLPVVIILGAVMSDLDVSPQRRIYFVMLIIGVLGWPMMARLVRGQILSLREQEYMLAAEALGLKDRHKIIRHLIPNVIPTIIVAATLAVGDAILSESALSFLGLGVAMPFPSWGNMVQAVRDTNDFMLRSWIWIPPGISIFITVLAVNFVGDGLRDAFDPKMKR